MRFYQALSCACVVLFSSASAGIQDPIKVDPQHYKIVVDNPSVRVLRIRYAPGEKSTVHQHPDSIVVPLNTSKVRFHLVGGKSEDNDMASEAAMFAPAGSHTPENIGANDVDALLVEFKGAKPGTAALPAARDNMAMKVLAESPRGAAYRMTAAPAFQEPEGTKHDFDQVVIALNDAQMMLAIDGKPAKTTWVRGDVQFIGRGVAHAAKNAGSKPTDFLIVMVK